MGGGGGGGDSHIRLYKGCATRIVEFCGPKTCGWVRISTQKPVDESES